MSPHPNITKAERLVGEISLTAPGIRRSSEGTTPACPPNGDPGMNFANNTCRSIIGLAAAGASFTLGACYILECVAHADIVSTAVTVPLLLLSILLGVAYIAGTCTAQILARLDFLYLELRRDIQIAEADEEDRDRRTVDQHLKTQLNLHRATAAARHDVPLPRRRANGQRLGVVE